MTRTRFDAEINGLIEGRREFDGAIDDAIHWLRIGRADHACEALADIARMTPDFASMAKRIRAEVLRKAKTKS